MHESLAIVVLKYLEVSTGGYLRTILKRKVFECEKTQILLKEKVIFDTFFAKVRYLPYFHEKSAKNTLFFKQKSAVFNHFPEF